MEKRKAALVFCTGLCLAVGTGGTLAYMNDSRQAVNLLTFAGEKGLDAILTETSWDPEKGLLTIPGSVIPKNPQVTNTSEINLNELVALKCQFVYTESCPDKEKRGKVLSRQDMEKVLQVYSIDYNSDDPEKGDWIRFEDQSKKDPVQCFYYSKVLERNLPKKGETTVPLFTNVSVDIGVNNRSQAAVREIGGVEIKISGTILQQMTGEDVFGLDDPRNAYEARLFQFENE